MSFFDLRVLSKSFRYALRGIQTTWRNEQNFRIISFAVGIVVIFIIVLPLATWELITLVLVATLILILELLNSAFEKMTDMLEPRIHSYAQMIKDIMAGAVLIASLVGLTIVLIIVLPHLINIFKT